MSNAVRNVGARSGVEAAAGAGARPSDAGAGDGAFAAAMNLAIGSSGGAAGAGDGATDPGGASAGQGDSGQAATANGAPPTGDESGAPNAGNVAVAATAPLSPVQPSTVQPATIAVAVVVTPPQNQAPASTPAPDAAVPTVIPTTPLVAGLADAQTGVNGTDGTTTAGPAGGGSVRKAPRDDPPGDASSAIAASFVAIAPNPVPAAPLTPSSVSGASDQAGGVNAAPSPTVTMATPDASSAAPNGGPSPSPNGIVALSANAALAAGAAVTPPQRPGNAPPSSDMAPVLTANVTASDPARGNGAAPASALAPIPAPDLTALPDGTPLQAQPPAPRMTPPPAPPSAGSSGGSSQSLAAQSGNDDSGNVAAVVAPAAPDAPPPQQPPSPQVTDSRGDIASAMILSPSMPQEASPPRAPAAADVVAVDGPAGATAPRLADATPSPADAAPSTGIANPDAFANAVAQRVIGMIANGHQEATLQLQPPQLGDLTVRVAVQGHDVSTWFASAQPQVQAAVSQAIDQLRADLAGAGFNLAGAWVGGDAATAQQGGYDGDAPSPRRAFYAPSSIAPAAIDNADAARSGVSIYV